VRPVGTAHSTRNLSRDCPAAAAGAAEADRAAAVILAAGLHALANGVQRLADLVVVAGAGDAAAVLRVLDLALALGEVELADLNVVLLAGAGERAGAGRLTEALELGAHRLIDAAANLEAALVLLELDLALHSALAIAGGRRALRGAGRPLVRIRRVLGSVRISLGGIDDRSGHRLSPEGGIAQRRR